MKRSELHVQIELVLEKLIANNKNLSVQQGKFSQLETDMLRKQCIELYDFINQLHMANVLDKAIVHSEIVEPKEVVIPKQEAKIEVDEPKIENEPKLELPIIEIKAEPEVRKLEPVIKVEPILEEVISPIKVEVIIDELKHTPEKNEVVISNPEITINETVKIEEPLKVVNEKTKEERVSELKKQLSHPIFDAPTFVPIAEKPAPIIVPPKKPLVEEKSILDKISETKTEKSLHESISVKKEERELSHGFSNSKINKIKDAIDISKRFEIQTRLFGEDSNAYNISINELENAGNIDNAMQLFNLFAKRYHWELEDELTQEMKSFLHRKY